MVLHRPVESTRLTRHWLSGALDSKSVLCQEGEHRIVEFLRMIELRVMRFPAGFLRGFPLSNIAPPAPPFATIPSDSGSLAKTKAGAAMLCMSSQIRSGRGELKSSLNAGMFASFQPKQ